MKKLRTQLENLQISFEEIIRKREEQYDLKSERWQDSDTGAAYQEKTELIQDMLEQVEEWQNELA